MLSGVGGEIGDYYDESGCQTAAMRRRRGLVATALLVGLIAGLVAVVGWRDVAGRRTPEKTAEVCDVDPTLSGFQGWCVQRRHRPPGIFTDEVAQVWIVGRQDGADLPRYTYLPLPSTAVDGRFDVTFRADGIDVTLEDGVMLVIPEDLYQLD